MKKLLLIAFLFFTAVTLKAQSSDTNEAKDGEMKRYYFVLLTSGTNKDYSDTAKMRSYQAGHMANIMKMAELGKLHIAGPFETTKQYRGIFIIDAKDEEEVKALIAPDVYIQEGYLSYEIIPWWSEKGAKLK